MNKLMHPDPYETIAHLQSLLRDLLSQYYPGVAPDSPHDPFIKECHVACALTHHLPVNEGEEGDTLPPPQPLERIPPFTAWRIPGLRTYSTRQRQRP